MTTQTLYRGNGIKIEIVALNNGEACEAIGEDQGLVALKDACVRFVPKQLVLSQGGLT